MDGVKKFHRPELRQNRHIDLSGLLYFGGIEATKRSRAVSQGVTAAQAAPMGQLGMFRVHLLIWMIHYAPETFKM